MAKDKVIRMIEKTKTLEMVPLSILEKDKKKPPETTIQTYHPAEEDREIIKPRLYLVKAFQEGVPRLRLIILPGKKEDIIGTEVPNEMLKKGIFITGHGDKIMSTLIGWAKFIPREYEWLPEELGFPPDSEIVNIPVLLVTSTIRMSRMFSYTAAITDMMMSGAHTRALRDYYLRTSIFLASRMRTILLENKELKRAVTTAEYNIISAAEHFGALLYRKREEAIPGGVEGERSIVDKIKELSDIITYIGLLAILGIIGFFILHSRGMI